MVSTGVLVVIVVATLVLLLAARFIYDRWRQPSVSTIQARSSVSEEDALLLQQAQQFGESLAATETEEQLQRQAQETELAKAEYRRIKEKCNKPKVYNRGCQDVCDKINEEEYQWKNPDVHSKLQDLGQQVDRCANDAVIDQAHAEGELRRAAEQAASEKLKRDYVEGLNPVKKATWRQKVLDRNAERYAQQQLAEAEKARLNNYWEARGFPKLAE